LSGTQVLLKVVGCRVFLAGHPGPLACRGMGWKTRTGT